MEKSNFQAVINYVKTKGFPDEEKQRKFAKGDAGEIHTVSKHRKDEEHQLETYFLSEYVFGLEVLWKYNRCEKCKQTRNKFGAVFYGNECKVVWFMRHGEAV